MSIPQPRKDEQGRIIGDFYPLQREELIALHKNKLINNAGYVHLALRYENPFCDRPIEIFPKEFALRWQMAESSVYAAIAALKEAKAIEIKHGRIVIEFTSEKAETIDTKEHSQQDSQQENFDSQQESLSRNLEFSQPSKSRVSRIQEKILDCQKELQIPRKDSKILEKDIYKERARALTDIPDISDSTDSAAVVENENVQEEENSQPTEEQINKAVTEVRQLSPEIEINAVVRKAIVDYWVNFPAALQHLKKAVRENWKCKLTGLLIKSLKNPPEDAKSAAIKPKEYPHPNLEQLNQLGSMGNIVHTRLNEPGLPEVLAVDIKQRGVLPWWDALGVSLEDLNVNKN
jgi:hypothetical protein